MFSVTILILFTLFFLIGVLHILSKSIYRSCTTEVGGEVSHCSRHTLDVPRAAHRTRPIAPAIVLLNSSSAVNGLYTTTLSHSSLKLALCLCRVSLRQTHCETHTQRDAVILPLSCIKREYWVVLLLTIVRSHLCVDVAYSVSKLGKHPVVNILL